MNLKRIKAFALDIDGVATDGGVLCSSDGDLLRTYDAKDGFAIRMLRDLSGRKHHVTTAVTLRNRYKTETFEVTTQVWFKALSQEEITYYVDTYKPFDKAGAYAIQEWIGHVGITRIEGSYFNVVGFPVQRVYEALLAF